MNSSERYEFPCVVCGEPRIGNFHRRCPEHESEKWRERCYLCNRTDGRPHDALLSPRVSPLRG